MTTAKASSIAIQKPSLPLGRRTVEHSSASSVLRLHQRAAELIFEIRVAQAVEVLLDTSRNHSRHWCDMKDCGNRAKVKRYYQRTRKAANADAI